MRHMRRIDSYVGKALETLEQGPYIHSKTFKEFNYLTERLKLLGFRGAGNVDIREDSLNRKIWHQANYDVIRTLGYTHGGIPLQDSKGISGNDYIFFFIRPREAA